MSSSGLTPGGAARTQGGFSLHHALRRAGGWALCPRVVLGIMLVATLIASVHALNRPRRDLNNYLIFEASARHLLERKPLYSAHPDEHLDLFKYSPIFAVAMIPLAAMPLWAGLTTWNLLNALAVYGGVATLPLASRARAIVLLLTLPTLLNNVQNEQSNGLMLGAMTAAAGLLHGGRAGWAAVLICAGVDIKLFAAVAGLLALIHPGRLRFVLVGTVALLVSIFAPALLTGWSYLTDQYRQWFDLLASDRPHAMNHSLATVLERVLGLSLPGGVLLGVGVVVLAAPLARPRAWSSVAFRLLTLALVLMWVVAFNHKAESPTYIIAMTGLALWYVTGPPTRWRSITIAVAFVLTALSSSDLFPRVVRDQVIAAYSVKAMPTALLVFVTAWELLTRRFDPPAPTASDARFEQVSTS